MVSSFTTLDFLLFMVAILPWTRCAVLRCDSNNRDPCTKFPDLCSEGGGLCVIKGPCEYECVCPPDGRRGRDCSKNSADPSPPKETEQPSGNSGSLVESLLVFPKDLFWDLNHVGEPLELVRISSPRPFIGGVMSSTLTIPAGSAKSVVEDSIESYISSATMSLVEQKTDGGHGITSHATVRTGSLASEETPGVNQHSSPSPERTVAPIAARLPTARTSDVLSTRTNLIIIEEDGDNKLLNSDISVNDESNSQSRSANSDDIVQFLESSTEKPDPSTTESNVSNGDMQNTEATQKSFDMLSDKSTPSAANASANIMTESITLVSNEISTTVSSISSLKTNSTSTNIKDVDRNGQLNVSDSTPSVSSLQPDVIHLDAKDMSSIDREPFPGHDMFPTFFSGHIKDSSSVDKDKPNAPLSVVVQRVFHRAEEFPVFRRNHE